MLGINESKEMVSFVCALLNGIGKTMEDGQVTWWDARHFIDAFQKATPAFNNAEEILVEIKGYSDEDRIQLTNMFAEELELSFDAAEVAIESAFIALVNLTKTVQFIKSFKESKVEGVI